MVLPRDDERQTYRHGRRHARAGSLARGHKHGRLVCCCYTTGPYGIASDAAQDNAGVPGDVVTAFLRGRGAS